MTAPARAIRQGRKLPDPGPHFSSPVAVSAAAIVQLDAAPATVSQRESSESAIDHHAANRLLTNFSRAYEDGNLDGMRAMFVSDVRDPRSNREAILDGYHRLFGNSMERSLQIRDVSWFTSGNTLTIIASFQSSVTSRRGSRPRRTHGDLRIDLRREDDQWRIVRLQNDERPG